MGRRHHEGSRLPGEFDPIALERFAAGILDRGVIFVSQDGVIAGVLSPAYAAPSHIMAVELFWSAEDGHGRELLCAFEAWAKDNDADEVRMTAVVGHRGGAVGRLLQARGYTPVEVSYGKAI